MNRYAIVNSFNVVTNIAIWDGESEWIPNDYQEFDVDGIVVGDPSPQTAVLDTDPPTARIGFLYNAVDGTFGPVPKPAVASQPGLLARLLSAINPFN
jgi:hypothetical protein